MNSSIVLAFYHLLVQKNSQSIRQLDWGRGTVLALDRGMTGVESRKPDGLSQLHVLEWAVSTQQTNQEPTLKAQSQA